MHEDVPGFKPLDPGRVNSIDPVELEYWCKELKCSARELVDAIAKVGEHTAEVRRALGQR